LKPIPRHLRSRHVHARRHADYSALNFSTPTKPPAAGPNELVFRVVEHLQKNTNNRPKRRKTLASHLEALCRKFATNTDVDALIEKLQKAGHLRIGEKEAVTYQIDPK